MTHTPLTKAERDELLAGHLFQSDPDSRDICRLLDDLDAAEAKIYGLKSRICGLDCRYTMGDVADISGSHCTKPCERCLADRDRMEVEAQRDRAESERDALKAKLDDPRRVLIHETEVVATKEEIAKLKKELADLSEADEDLHACRALVNATSENLSVDLERMVDDLAEANEKAARSEKDAHSWCELYTDTKAKLAALVEVGERWVTSNEPIDAGNPFVDHDLKAAIAAARGGAS